MGGAGGRRRSCGSSRMCLSSRIEHLRSSTNETFITCSNVYAFESSSSGKKKGTGAGAGAEGAAEADARQHHANSLTLIANQLELAALLAIRGYNDASEDAGDVLISLASLLGIEGSASAPTKMRAANALYRNAPYVDSKGRIAAGAGGKYNLRRYHELFLRSAIAVSAFSLGSVNSAARLFSDSVGDWQNLLKDVVDLRRQGVAPGEEEGADGVRGAGGSQGHQDDDDDDDFDERVWYAMEGQVHSLMCTVEECVAACVIAGYESGSGVGSIEVALRTAAKFGDVEEEEDAQAGGSDDGRESSVEFATPEHVRVHALYLQSRAKMAMAQDKNGHRSLKHKRTLLKEALAAAVDCHAAAPAEACYVYHCALYHCLLRQFGDGENITSDGDHALALAKLSVELTHGRSAACWMLLALLLTSLSCTRIALDTINRALELGWAPRDGAGAKFEYVQLLMVKAAILADMHDCAPGSADEQDGATVATANKSESMQLLIEALSTLKHVVPKEFEAEGIEGRSGVLDARRDELIAQVWEQMGTIYLTSGENSELYSECIQQAEASCEGYKPSLSADAMQLLRSLKHAALQPNVEATDRVQQAAKLHSSNGSVALASALLYDALDEDLTDDSAYSALAMLKTGTGDVDGGSRALMVAARLESSRPALSFAMLPRTPFACE